jgi:hypothetical protein
MSYKKLLPNQFFIISFFRVRVVSPRSLWSLSETTEGDNSRPAVNCFSVGKVHPKNKRELKGTFGIYIAKVAVAYSIDIEEDLASIIPGEDID